MKSRYKLRKNKLAKPNSFAENQKFIQQQQ